MSETITERAANGVSYEPTKLTWWDIYLADLEVGKAFYGQVFGWTFQAFDDDFTMCFDATGELICGMGVSTDPPPGRSGLRCYFSVQDLEGHLSRAEAAGGSVKTARTLISEEFGWYAEFSDPSGNPVGLCSSTPPT